MRLLGNARVLGLEWEVTKSCRKRQWATTANCSQEIDLMFMKSPAQPHFASPFLKKKTPMVTVCILLTASLIGWHIYHSLIIVIDYQLLRRVCCIYFQLLLSWSTSFPYVRAPNGFSHHSHQSVSLLIFCKASSLQTKQILFKHFYKWNVESIHWERNTKADTLRVLGRLTQLSS